MTLLTRGLRRIVPSLPLWSMQLSAPPSLSVLKKKHGVVPSPLPSKKDEADQVIIYFPSCISRVMGGSADGKKSILQVFMNVSAKAGISVIIPQDINGTCCGQIFSSKGFQDAYRYTANLVVEKLWNISREGKYPVVMDASSCVYTLKLLRPALNESNREKYDGLIFLDSVDYLLDKVVPLVQVIQKKPDIVLHPVCSLQKMGTQDKFIRLARYFAQKVTIPLNAGCCGMAGDRGFLFPELTRSATAAEAAEVSCNSYSGYYSSAKTCEMAMSEAVGQNYESILYLAEEVLG